MLTAQNNQPDETPENDIQIDSNLQETINQITQDLEIEPTYGDTDQVLSEEDVRKNLIADPKSKTVVTGSTASPFEVPRLDPVSVSADQAAAQTQVEDIAKAPILNVKPIVETVNPVKNLTSLIDTPVVSATDDGAVDSAGDNAVDSTSVSTDDVSSQSPSTEEDDLGIAEQVFSKPPATQDLASQGPVEVEQAETVTTIDHETASSEDLVSKDEEKPIITDQQIVDSSPITPPAVDNTTAVTNQQSATNQTVSDQPTASSSFVATNSFFDILVNNDIISLNQAEELRQENLSTGRDFEELLLSKQLATETEIVQAKAEYNNLPYIKLSVIGVDPEALTLIDEGIAKRYQVLPFSVDKQKNSLKVAMIDPLDLAAVEFLKQKTNHNIEAHYSENSEIIRMIEQNYAQSLSSEVTEALKSTTQYNEQESNAVQLDKQAGAILRDAPINRIVENMLDFAIKASASDIHIEPQINRTRVRYRIDGILVEKLILPQNVHEAVVSRIKIMANLKIDEKRLPQDGRFNYQTSNSEIDLRTSTLPTVHGEKIVMRLLKKDMAVPSLEDLGLFGLGLQRLKEAIKIPYGIILITGPTGSGKTTTLYSILNIINKVGVNIMTLEDPVEYQIPGVSQVQTNPKAGLTFASGLRSFLRQDPDIIMVGEIRDNETADLALQASLTGHLVFSTLHTNSAAGALPRLLDMEAEPFLLASSITLSMGQRVVRKINDSYKEEYKPEPVVIEDIKKVLGVHFDRWCKDLGKNPNDITLFRPSSKRPATEPEYKGRIGIFEVMPTSPEIASLILNRKPASEIENMGIQQGMTLMKQDGYLKVLEGITTIEEVLRVAEVG